MTPDQQIDHIVRMMLEGEWKGSRSHRELAAGWGCHPRTVGDRAVAAAAVVARLGGPVQELVRAKLAELEHIKEVAMSLHRPVVVSQGQGAGSAVELFPAPDVKAAEQAVRTYLQVLGAFNHVKKTEVRNIQPGEDPRAVRAKLLEAVADIDKQLEAEPKEVH